MDSPAAACVTPPASNLEAQCKMGCSKSGEVFKVKSDKSEVLLEIQSILRKLLVKDIRDDFKAGLIIKVDQPEDILNSIDSVFDVFHPAFTTNQVNRKLQIADTLNHIKLLIEESDEIFLLPNERLQARTFSYRVWMHAFRKIMSSTYWLKQTTGVTAACEFSELEDSLPRTPELKKTRFCKPILSDSSEGSRECDQIRRKCRKRGTTRKTKKKIETIIISDSSTDSSAAEESPDSSFVGRSRRGQRRYVWDVVQPACFDIDGKQSLKQFLETYERYFKNRYDGSQRECTQELGKFINGELKDAYDALGGAQRKYRDERRTSTMVPDPKDWENPSVSSRISQSNYEAQRILKTVLHATQGDSSKSFPE